MNAAFLRMTIILFNAYAKLPNSYMTMILFLVFFNLKNIYIEREREREKHIWIQGLFLKKFLTILF